MRTVIRRSVLTALAVPLLSARTIAAAQSSEQTETALATVEGNHVEYRRRLGRSPTVVFESGLGDGLESWDAVFASIDPALSLFSYSRPGYGRSALPSPIDTERTGVETAHLLDATLTAVGIQPPYILVGHSLGGLYVTVYAGLYPEKLAGLVYVDGRPPGFFSRCVREGVASCGTRVQRPATLPAQILAEGAGVPATETQAIVKPAMRRIPATVIVATRLGSAPDADRVAAAWRAEQQTFAEGFCDHRVVFAEGAGHYVHQDAPALVAREIERRL